MLVQLKDGTWIDQSELSRVIRIFLGRSIDGSSDEVCMLGDDGVHVANVSCTSREEAKFYRDELAALVNQAKSKSALELANFDPNIGQRDLQPEAGGSSEMSRRGATTAPAPESLGQIRILDSLDYKGFTALLLILMDDKTSYVSGSVVGLPTNVTIHAKSIGEARLRFMDLVDDHLKSQVGPSVSRPDQPPAQSGPDVPGGQMRTMDPSYSQDIRAIQERTVAMAEEMVKGMGLKPGPHPGKHTDPTPVETGPHAGDPGGPGDLDSPPDPAGA